MNRPLSDQLSSLRIERKRTKRRSLSWLLVPLGIGAIGVAVWLGYERLGSALLLPTVEVATVTTLSAAQEASMFTVGGYVVAPTRMKLGVDVAGRVSKVHVRQGDKVKKGQLLIELDDEAEQSAVVAADAEAEVALARAEAARANLEEVEVKIARERGLVETGIRGRAGLDDLEARAKALKKTHKASRAEAKAAGLNAHTMRGRLKSTSLKAPLAGTIVSALPQVGELVSPSTPFVDIADLGSLFVETDVPEAQLYQVKVGAPCEIALDAYPNKRFAGKVHELGKLVDRAKATVSVLVALSDATDAVLPNMSASVSFLSEPLDEQARAEKPKLVVPASAVVERQGVKAVFLLLDETVRLTPVQVGSPVEGGVELVQGPAPNSRVVVDPPEQLRDGQRVALPEKE